MKKINPLNDQVKKRTTSKKQTGNQDMPMLHLSFIPLSNFMSRTRYVCRYHLVAFTKVGVCHD
ncbi:MULTISPECIES: hypothetical protein [Shouchella]|uniref:Uncharacterized protein n=3 Tax=Bacillaceae TaxID=186817 RepID=A0A060M3G4_9BACI|nr:MULTISPECIES: hypothetical protein [Bacillaceae]RQW20473.1 hypothetical protein EH196_10180 [Bacillus sp. C1-1]AIC94604.1 hypothetical protein BleG1_2026 [Shouchella lehensis G1]KQL51837.1 hypothetical protein AN965_18945 [Alkalicoccobacillus plakortidis]MBG9784505.1 hypothetical protein [Shouchella lehensis]TES50489.1 hypothetical protein E2L03_00720 [Shouchella lehensis]